MYTHQSNSLLLALLRPLFEALREILKPRREPTRYEVWNV